MARDSGTMGTEQNRPMRTPGTAKRLRSVATTRSQAATTWQPAAVAMPSTAATTGCGTLRIIAINSQHTSKSSS